MPLRVLLSFQRVVLLAGPLRSGSGGGSTPCGDK